MVRIAPTDPFLRKIVLPSIIRISDARKGGHTSNPILKPSKAAVSSRALRVVLGQLKLELK